MPILEITALTIKEFVVWRRKKGHKDATIRRQLTPLRSAFQRAKNLDLLTDNHIPSFVLPWDSEPREGFLEPDDFDLILEKLPTHLKPVCTVHVLHWSPEGLG
jgi:site-specific recombinase XerD